MSSSKEETRSSGKLEKEGNEHATPIALRRAEDLVLVMDTPKGRGVFAAKDIPAKTVLEVSPVLVLDPAENAEHICKTDLFNYTYNWPYMPTAKAPEGNLKGRVTMTQAIIFGLGSMFNHSGLNQNVVWERDLRNLLITYSTLRDIKAGEELCISYGDRLTFKDADREREENRDPDDWTDVLNIIDFID
ncbi:hypothetical protein B0O99DRAFT_680292 [Bisporella sp. PMI_857]|nr:hypothetical protein B0O99DRAFT_680292 [Bisporella sp. PMI_857]